MLKYMNIIDLDLILDRNPNLGDRGFQSDGRTFSLMSRPTGLKGYEPKNEGEYYYKEAYSFLANDNPVMAGTFWKKPMKWVTLELATIWPMVFVTDGSVSGTTMPQPLSTGNWLAKATLMP